MIIRAEPPSESTEVVAEELAWAIRTGSDPEKYASAVRAAIKDVDPHLLVTEMQPVDTLVDKAQASTRFSLLLIGVFAVIAGVLAGVGLYAVMAFSVAQRTRAIGVRIALGAESRDVMRLVVGEGVRVTIAGVVVGLGLAMAGASRIGGLLFEESPRDPAVYLVVVGTLLFVGILASAVPASRAARVDPNAALRDE